MSLKEYCEAQGGAIGVTDAAEYLATAGGFDWVDVRWVSTWWDECENAPRVGRSRVLTADMCEELEDDVESADEDDEEDDDEDDEDDEDEDEAAEDDED